MMALACNYCSTLSSSVFEFLHIKTKFVIMDVLSTNLSLFAVEGHHRLSDLQSTWFPSKADLVFRSEQAVRDCQSAHLHSHLFTLMTPICLNECLHLSSITGGNSNFSYVHGGAKSTDVLYTI